MAGETLRVLSGAGAGTQIPLSGEFVIGRAEVGAGNLAGDSEISRRHARFQATPYGQVILEDLGSTNGTYVNGERVGAPRVLAPGDQVTMGKTVVQFEGAPAPATAAAPAPAPAAFAPPPPAALSPVAYGAGQPGAGPAAAGPPPPPSPSPTSSRPAWLLPLGIAVALLAVVAAIVAVATNSGSDTSSTTALPQRATQPAAAPPGTTPGQAPAVRSVAGLEASLRSVLNGASTSGPRITAVTCPPNAPSAAGSTFACAVRGGQGLAGSVTVTLKDSQRKAYKFKAMLQGNGFTRTVSGTAS